MDTLTMLKSYVARPEPVPVWIDYSSYPRDDALHRRLSYDLRLLNTAYLLATDGRLMFEMQREPQYIEGITIAVVPTLPQFGKETVTQGMHRGNGLIEVVPEFVPGTLPHEIGHIIFGPDHHPDNHLYAKRCVRGRYVGPAAVCPEDKEEIKRKLGIRR